MQKENTEFIPIHFQNFSNTSPEINTIKDIKTLIQILENKAKLEQNTDKNKYKKYMNKCKEEAKKNIEELKKLYSGETYATGPNKFRQICQKFIFKNYKNLFNIH